MFNNIAGWDDLNVIRWIFQVNIFDYKAIIEFYVDVANKIVEEMLLSALNNVLHVLTDFLFGLFSLVVWIFRVGHQKETNFVLLINKNRE